MKILPRHNISVIIKDGEMLIEPMLILFVVLWLLCLLSIIVYGGDDQ